MRLLSLPILLALSGAAAAQTYQPEPFRSPQPGFAQTDITLCQARTTPPQGDPNCTDYTPDRELECFHRWQRRVRGIAGDSCARQAELLQLWTWGGIETLELEVLQEAIRAERDAAEAEADEAYLRCLCSDWRKWLVSNPWQTPNPAKPVTFSLPVDPNPDRTMLPPDAALVEHLVGLGYDVQSVLAAFPQGASR